MRVIDFVQDRKSTTRKIKQSLRRPRARDLGRWPLRPIVVKRGTEFVTYYL